MKVLRYVVVALIIVTGIYAFSACIRSFPETEKADQCFDFSLDFSRFKPYTGYSKYGIVPLDGEAFLYFQNGWDTAMYDADTKNPEYFDENGFNDSAFWCTNIYKIDPDVVVEKITSIGGGKVYQILSCGDNYLVFKNTMRNDYSEIEKDLTLISMNNQWEEEWQYLLEGVCSYASVLGDKIIMETMKESYTWTVLNRDGSVFMQNTGTEKLVYITSSKDFSGYYMITRKDRSQKLELSVLQEMDKKWHTISKGTLPFGASDEEIIRITAEESGNLLLFTDKSVYTIDNQSFERKVDLYSRYIPYIDKNGPTSSSVFSPVDSRQAHGVYLIGKKGEDSIILDIFDNKEKTMDSIRWLESHGEPTWSYVDDFGALVVVSEQKDGVLTVCKWMKE